MFPTKNMMDYMTEMNRLFPKTGVNEAPSPNIYNTNYTTQSPFFTTMANQSSSSADSTSPESFPDISGFKYRPRYTPIPESHTETPNLRRQRPIIGRKIMSNTDNQYERHPFDHRQIAGISPIKVIPNDDWSQDIEMSLLTKRARMDNPNSYELFPSETRGSGFRTPGRNTPQQICWFNTANVSPSSGISGSPVSPLPQRYMTPPPRRSFLSPAPFMPNEDTGRVCSFCRKNGETPMVYMTHVVKERVGNRSIVTCPILRSHVCATCHATGDNAHTITYCPVLRSNNNGFPLQSTTITLKNTRVKSNGRKRY